MTTSANAALAAVQAQRARQHYQQAQALTVSPGQLVVLLYDGALKFMRRARMALDDRQLEVAHNAICRAQNIIVELDSTLDDRAGNVSEDLHRIYDYCYRRLIEANMSKDPAPLGEVIAHFEALLETWRQVVSAHDATGTPGNASGPAPVQVQSVR